MIQYLSFANDRIVCTEHNNNPFASLSHIPSEIMAFNLMEIAHIFELQWMKMGDEGRCERPFYRDSVLFAFCTAYRLADACDKITCGRSYTHTHADHFNYGSILDLSSLCSYFFFCCIPLLFFTFCCVCLLRLLVLLLIALSASHHPLYLLLLPWYSTVYVQYDINNSATPRSINIALFRSSPRRKITKPLCI